MGSIPSPFQTDGRQFSKDGKVNFVRLASGRALHVGRGRSSIPVMGPNKAGIYSDERLYFNIMVKLQDFINF